MSLICSSEYLLRPIAGRGRPESRAGGAAAAAAPGRGGSGARGRLGGRLSARGSSPSAWAACAQRLAVYVTPRAIVARVAGAATSLTQRARRPERREGAGLDTPRAGARSTVGVGARPRAFVPLQRRPLHWMSLKPRSGGPSCCSGRGSRGEAAARSVAPRSEVWGPPRRSPPERGWRPAAVVSDGTEGPGRRGQSWALRRGSRSRVRAFSVRAPPSPCIASWPTDAHPHRFGRSLCLRIALPVCFPTLKLFALRICPLPPPPPRLPGIEEGRAAVTSRRKPAPCSRHRLQSV